MGLCIRLRHGEDKGGFHRPVTKRKGETNSRRFMEQSYKVEKKKIHSVEGRVVIWVGGGGMKEQDVKRMKKEE